MRAKIDPELIEELDITNIQPVKKHNGGINGVGNISCFGFIGDQKVKIYTTYRADLPELREKLEEYKFVNKVRFPPLIATKGKFVVEEWIDGPNLTQIPKSQVKELIPAMVDFLFEFKEIDIDFNSSYDHLRCFRDAVAKRGDNNLLVSTWEQEFKKQEEIPKHLRHGDLHEANLILNDGHMYSIDNDGVSFDNGWFLSWRKSFLYSTAFPTPPFDNEKLEMQYYGNVSYKFMRLTHMLRKAFFGRLTHADFIKRYQQLFGQLS